MNDNLNTPTTEFKPVPVKLTDGQLEKLLAGKAFGPGSNSEPLDGKVAYLTDADEAADEPTPTVH